MPAAAAAGVGAVCVWLYLRKSSGISPRRNKRLALGREPKLARRMPSIIWSLKQSEQHRDDAVTAIRATVAGKHVIVRFAKQAIDDSGLERCKAHAEALLQSYGSDVPGELLIESADVPR
jgi:hypothetical protein